jgi:hypothetical protein
MEILKFGDFVNEDNSSMNEQEEMLVNNFKTDVERILVQKVARPNFAEGTFGSNTKSLRDMIQDLEYLIADYKAKM